MATSYFINWIVAAETIQGGNYSREETILGNTVNGRRQQTNGMYISLEADPAIAQPKKSLKLIKRKRSFLISSTVCTSRHELLDIYTDYGCPVRKSP